MRSSFINFILILFIILILAGIGFMARKVFHTPPEDTLPTVKKFTPIPIVNRGKVSEERDAALESDVRKISDATRAYAKDHKGAYPESDFKNPCTGVRFCLKSVNINTQKKIYVNPIPQTREGNVDYHYQADNAKKTYCVKSPGVLETASTMLYQCTAVECKRVPFAQSCTQ